MPATRASPTHRLLSLTAAALLTAALLVAPPAAADHDLTLHASYELGPYGDAFSWACVPGYVTEPVGDEQCDPTGLTSDGSIDFGGVVFRSGELDGFDHAQASIVDDVYGAGGIGGWLCTDNDGDDMACNASMGEMQVSFCGTSASSLIPSSYVYFGVFINGALFQTLDCDPSAAPTSTTGGIFDPAGGVYLSFTH